jgi:hypothetical protein
LPLGHISFKIFRYRTPRNKPSLVGVDKVGDEVTEPEGEAFCVNFEV